MLKKTHEAFSGVFWLGGTLGINIAALRMGYSEMPIHPAVAIAGTILAAPFSAGKNSPDIDQIWWPGPPRRNYQWNGHRGITHRIWFASLISSPFLILAYVYWQSTLPALMLPILFALPAGWWSHLFGDMIYGRILICGHPFGLGWETGGLTEIGRRKHGGPRYVIDPAAKVCRVIVGTLAVFHLFMLVTYTLGI
jgi:hypothetical protein